MLQIRCDASITGQHMHMCEIEFHRVSRANGVTRSLISSVDRGLTMLRCTHTKCPLKENGIYNGSVLWRLLNPRNRQTTATNKICNRQKEKSCQVQ